MTLINNLYLHWIFSLSINIKSISNIIIFLRLIIFIMFINFSDVFLISFRKQDIYYSIYHYLYQYN